MSIKEEFIEYSNTEDFYSILDDKKTFKNMNPKDYAEFVNKTIDLISKNSGLKLMFSEHIEDSCYDFKNKIIKIPPPPPFLKDINKFIVNLGEWRGVLNHEVGHALNTFWRPSYEEKIIEEEKKYPEKIHTFVDLFENGRMERVVCKRFPGMKRDLLKLEGSLRKIILKHKKEMDKKGEWNDFHHLYYGIRLAIHGYDTPTKIPEHLKEDWEVCMNFIREAWQTDIEKETVEIANKAFEFFKEKVEETKKELKEQLKEKQEKKENEEKGIEVEIEFDNENDEENDKKESEDKESKKDKKDKENEEKGTEVEIKFDNENDEENDKKESEDKESKKDKENEDKEEKEIKKIKIKIKECDISKLKDVNVIEKYIENTSKYNPHTIKKSEDVIPLPLDLYVKKIEVKPNKDEKEETRKYIQNSFCKISSLAQNFINRVRSSRHVKTRTYKGKISARHLHKYRHSKNIFKTELKRKKKDAVVYIVIDCSGSMSGEKIKTARKAALMIGEIMYKAKVQFELIGFTIRYNLEYRFRPYTRTADLIHYYFGNDKNWNYQKNGVLNGYLPYKLQDNDDGESLRHLTKDILKSPKERKIMIVISDGMPHAVNQSGNESKDLMKVIQEARDNGIDMFSIGLGTYSSNYYGNENSIEISANSSDIDIIKAISVFINKI